MAIAIATAITPDRRTTARRIERGAALSVLVRGLPATNRHAYFFVGRQQTIVGACPQHVLAGLRKLDGRLRLPVFHGSGPRLDVRAGWSAPDHPRHRKGRRRSATGCASTSLTPAARNLRNVDRRISDATLQERRRLLADRRLARPGG